MGRKSLRASTGKFLAWAAGTITIVVASCVGSLPAQTPEGPSTLGTAFTDDAIVPASCATCGNGLLGGGSYLPGPGPCVGGCGNGCGDCCSPARNCDCCFNPKTCVGRFFNGIYQCICCPDPCYVPQWIPAANAAFFVDQARPITQMRLRYDAGFGVNNIDRAEYFVAQQGASGGKGPRGLTNSANYQDLSLYMEGAINSFGIFVEMPYRQFKPQDGLLGATSASGFGDLNVGTKTLLLDCELLQFTFQFRTYIPTGNFTEGLGVGHVSLEPSFLAALKMTERAYLQMQSSYWIPIGGSSGYQGNIWHNHVSWNQILCKPCNDLQLIGTLEANEWTVLNGGYTSVAGMVPGRAGIVSAGPGLRTVICTNIDAGVGTAFALTDNHWPTSLFRAEFRWRY